MFTHELLSALSGAADINGDGKVEYSEVQAFIGSANRDVKDPRAVPHVIARPPAVWQNVPLVTLADIRHVTWLHGNPTALGHFYIELENGQRYLDANVSESDNLTLALPDDAVAFLRTPEREAELALVESHDIEIDKLKFGRMPTGERGATDAAYRQGLFASSYTPAYYRGFVDSTGGVSVAFDLLKVARMAEAQKEAMTRPWLVAAGTGGAGALIVSGVTLGLMLKAKSDFDHTSLQKTAHEANGRFVRYRDAAVASGIAALGLGGLTWWLWPRQSSSPVVGATLDSKGIGVVWQSSW